jgi:hypothetical protein
VLGRIEVWLGEQRSVLDPDQLDRVDLVPATRAGCLVE